MDSEPRKLTEEEILDITSVIKKVYSASQETSESVLEQIKKRLREQLSEVVVTPLAIPELKREILNSFEKSLIEPGTPVGIMAAEALGHPITQMALNSFKTSGTSKQIVTGVDRVRNLVNISKNIKNPSCKIFFSDHPTFNEVYLQKQAGLVGLNVSSLILDYEVSPPKDIFSEVPWGYKAFEHLFDKSPSLSSYMLRLKINLDVAVLHQVTLKDISDAIEASSNPPTVVCIYSPLPLGIIDVYTIESNIQQQDFVFGNTSLVFISTKIIPFLDKIFIKGIENIKSIFPEKIPVKSVYLDEIKLNDHEYRINLHPVRVESTGITGEKYAELCNAVGLIPNQIERYSLIVHVPSQFGNKNPNLIIQEAIDKEEKEESEYEKKNPEDLWTSSTIQRYSQLIYAEAEGSDLNALFQRDDIDYKHTVSNDPNEILAKLGIEAARTFLILEFINALYMDKSYIDPRHILLMVEFQTYQGRLVPATYSGVQSQPIGALSKATFEKPLDIFRRRAPFGIMEEVSSVSAAIALGSHVPLGTGRVEVITDPEAMAKAEKMTVAELKAAIEETPLTLEAQQKELEILFGINPERQEESQKGQELQGLPAERREQTERRKQEETRKQRKTREQAKRREQKETQEQAEKREQTQRQEVRERQEEAQETPFPTIPHVPILTKKSIEKFKDIPCEKPEKVEFKINDKVKTEDISETEIGVPEIITEIKNEEKVKKKKKKTQVPLPDVIEFL